MPAMIRLNDALEMVLRETRRLAPDQISLLNAKGRILAEDVVADVNLPPFPRSSMDGYAVRAVDVAEAPVQLEVAATIPAGRSSDIFLQPGQAAKVMTGAPVPNGADAIQIVEKTRSLNEGGSVEILEPVTGGANIAPRGSEAHVNEVVATTGSFISPAVIGLLAAVGKNVVSVYGVPSVALLSTGDELIEISEQPRNGQIRNSNSYALHAQVSQVGARPYMLGIAKDRKSHLKHYIAQGLRYDVLLLSGGVSMGDLDLVEEVLGEAGFEILFNKVAVKPGKPTVFAKSGQTLIFGLPGNPVSASTIFELLVRPALRKMMGFPLYQNQLVSATLTQHFPNRSDREYYAPAVTWYEDNRFFVRPLRSRGSADVVTYASSNSYLICPSERPELIEGDDVEVMLRTEFSYH